MTIIQPLSAAGIGTVVLRPLPDVQPFSIQSGYSFEGILSDMRTWLRDVLVPYLEDSSAQAIFQSNVDTMISTVNSALTTQSSIVTSALNTAVNEVITADIPIADGVVSALLALSTSATRVYLDGRYVFTAPAPLGAGQDDTAVLAALFNAAAATGGTVRLREGVYLCNVSIVAGFTQPTIIGAGRAATTLRSFTPGAAPVVKFNGGSGAISGGGLRSLTVDGVAKATQLFGIAMSGAGGVEHRDVRITNCDSAIVFWNERTNDFTEFCTFEGSIDACGRAALYKIDNTVESFHGSGIVGNTVVQMPSDVTGPVVQMLSTALPYNAPLSLTVFFTNALQYLIDYGNPNSRAASFHGDVRMENAQVLTADSALCRGGNSRVYLVGGIMGLGLANVVLGSLFLASKVSYAGGTILAQLKPVTARYTLKNSPTQALASLLVGGEMALLTLHVVGPNYDRAELYLVMQSPYNDTGTVVLLATTQSVDTSGIGEPTVTWSGYGLYLANASFTSAFTAHATLTPIGGGTASSLLDQQTSA